MAGGYNESGVGAQTTLRPSRQRRERGKERRGGRPSTCD
jgi:hypothetical protein